MYTILQIIISVVVVYLIFSTIVTVMVEWVASLLQLRGKVLRGAVLNLFKDSPNAKKNLGETILNHPRVKSTTSGMTLRKNERLPSYISASSISSALIDIMVNKAAPVTADGRIKNVYENFLDGVNKTTDKDEKALLSSLANVSSNIESLSASIEKWFNDGMDRASGSYKRNIRIWTFAFAMAITIAFNIDTLHIIRVAKQDPTLRLRLNELADQLLADSVFKEAAMQGVDVDYYEDYVNDSSISESDGSAIQNEDMATPDNSLEEQYNVRAKQLQYMNTLVGNADLPIGWGIKKDHSLLFSILGWFLTVLALTAGAPFWFDALKNIVNIRNAGPKPGNSK
ncbi:MAG TPA: hypothetical protein VFU05_20725 [Cyclobacteriaceae bacterium]|nr:hypothetical protein [Cyclobacteriaceae bacterium]